MNTLSYEIICIICKYLDINEVLDFHEGLNLYVDYKLIRKKLDLRCSICSYDKAVRNTKPCESCYQYVCSGPRCSFLCDKTQSNICKKCGISCMDCDKVLPKTNKLCNTFHCDRCFRDLCSECVVRNPIGDFCTVCDHSMCDI